MFGELGVASFGGFDLSVSDKKHIAPNIVANTRTLLSIDYDNQARTVWVKRVGNVLYI